MKSTSKKAVVAKNTKKRRADADESESDADDADIQAGLASALVHDGTNWRTNATFSYEKTHKIAANPVLQLKDIGVVGLPLSERDALVIKGHAVEAAFGAGQRKKVKKPACDTWEMDAGMITIGNPVWDEFMASTVNEICTMLGAKKSAGDTRYELHKLVLHETGSYSLPHVDTQKGDGSFATVTVVLPSKFTGCAARLTHGALSAIYDCSDTSFSQTTVLSWYTGVAHELEPITSGYRLALSYNLIYTGTSIAPALSSNAELPIQKLRRLLQRWKQADADDAPDEIVLLLHRECSTLRGSELKHSDANKVGVLSLLAKELGFQIGLATAVYALSGQAARTDDRWYKRSGSSRWQKWLRGSVPHDPTFHDDDFDSEDDEEEDNKNGEDDRGQDGVDDLEFAESEEYLERTRSIEGLVDLDGAPIARELSLDEVTTIPDNLVKILEGAYGVQTTNNKHCGLTLVRRSCRAVLVIWPTAVQAAPAVSSKRPAEIDVAPPAKRRR